MTVPPLSVRLARCRVVRRDDSMVFKAPRNVFVDLVYNLPGIYLARIVATLDVCDASIASGSEPPVAGKCPLVETEEFPRDKFVVESDSNAPVNSSNGGSLKIG